MLIKKLIVRGGQCVDVLQCIQEMADAQPAKQVIKDSGKIMYWLTKTKNKLMPIYEKLSENENHLRNDAITRINAVKVTDEGLSETDRKGKEQEMRASIQKDAQEQIKKLFDEEYTVDVPQLELEASEVFQKYMKAHSTFTLFDLMTEGEYEPVLAETEQA